MFGDWQSVVCNHECHRMSSDLGTHAVLMMPTATVSLNCTISLHCWSALSIKISSKMSPWFLFWSHQWKVQSGIERVIQCNISAGRFFFWCGQESPHAPAPWLAESFIIWTRGSLYQHRLCGKVFATSEQKFPEPLWSKAWEAPEYQRCSEQHTYLHAYFVSHGSHPLQGV